MKALNLTSLTVALLGATVGASVATASDIQIYGSIDMGLNYHSRKVDGAPRTDAAVMYSGQFVGNRLGFKGSEDLGNGTKVGFVLESGIDYDTGALRTPLGSDRLFGREANLYVAGSLGTLSFGRVGALSSGVGSYDLAYGRYSPFGIGAGDYSAGRAEFMALDRDRFDNTITYVSPSMQGVKLYAQYSFEADYAESAQSSNNKRYAAIGLNFERGAFSTSFVADRLMNPSKPEARPQDDANRTNTQDGMTLTWGASYEAEFAKFYTMVQYADHEKRFGGYAAKDFADGTMFANQGLQGLGVSAAVMFPALSGKVLAQVNYTEGKTAGDVEYDDASNVRRAAHGDISRAGMTVGYFYPASKRTWFYGYGGFNRGKQELRVNERHEDIVTKDVELGTGIVHWL